MNGHRLLGTSGPNDLPLTYYKMFSNTLSSHVLSAYNSISDGRLVPQDTLRAHITVITKESKNPSQCQIYWPLWANLPMCLLSTDAKKTFNKVNWDCMHETFRPIALAPNMFNWISSLYSSPLVLLKVNGSLSSPFLIANVTWQGCPLLPLIFYFVFGTPIML